MKAAMDLLQIEATAQGKLVADEPVPMLHNCVIKRTFKGGKVKIENVPPDRIFNTKNC